MLVGFGLGAVRGVQQIIKHIGMFGGHELTTSEQAMQEAKSETSMAQGGDN
jgi:TRAP-type mannitol/chloroaromatic compound transport system permease small subunit